MITVLSYGGQSGAAIEETQEKLRKQLSSCSQVSGRGHCMPRRVPGEVPGFGQVGKTGAEESVGSLLLGFLQERQGGAGQAV